MYNSVYIAHIQILVSVNRERKFMEIIDTEVMITFEGKDYTSSEAIALYNKMTDDMIAMMSESQKREYIRRAETSKAMYELLDTCKSK